MRCGRRSESWHWKPHLIGFAGSRPWEPALRRGMLISIILDCRIVYRYDRRCHRIAVIPAIREPKQAGKDC